MRLGAPRRFRVRVRRNRTFQRTDGVSRSAGEEIVLSEHEAAWTDRKRIVDVLNVEGEQTRNSPQRTKNRPPP